MKRVIFVLAVLSASVLHATTISVPSDQPTIQAGIDSSGDLDTVLVADGHYYERITFDGKNIVVASELIVDGDSNHILATIIDGDSAVVPVVADTGCVVRVVNNEPAQAALYGFTITNGIGSNGNGGGILITSPTFTVCGCRFVSNSVESIGGGLWSKTYGSLTVTNCEFKHNSAGQGGGFHSERFASFVDCVVCSNSAADGAGGDLRQSIPSLSGLSVFDNYGDGMMCYTNGDTFYIADCDFSGNSGTGLKLGLYIPLLNGASPDKNLQAEGNLSGCSFLQNAADGLSLRGGGWNSVSLDNCRFEGNAGTGLASTYDVYTITANACSFIGNGQLAMRVRGEAFLTGCLFDGNLAGVAQIDHDCQIANSTIVRNSGVCFELGAGDKSLYSCDISNSIIAFNDCDSLAVFHDVDVTVSCSDIFGNGGGDWIGLFASQLDSNGNFSADPQFCDTATGEFTLMDISPCAAANNECEELIGLLPVGCSGVPVVQAFSIPLEADMMHVLNHIPEFSWSFFDPVAANQDSFEIGVGTDDDWSVSEMWNPDASASSDTSVSYGGAILDDGATYWARVRVHNGYAWSDWYQISFRMNSIPSDPVLAAPVAEEILPTSTPEFTLENSIDPDGDSLFYTLQVSPDSFESMIEEYVLAADSGGTTSFVVPSPLDEDTRYWWRVKASDDFEETEFTAPATFWVNTVNSAPSDFDLLDPPDFSGCPVSTLTPVLSWSESLDPDPQDSVLYDLHISADSTFSVEDTIRDIPQPACVHIDSLSWGTKYWWKVLARDQNGGQTWSGNVFSFRTVTPGDANASGAVDIDDVTYIIAYVFSGGPEPLPMVAGDTNCSGDVDIDDIVYLLTYIFASGPAPCISPSS